MKKTPQQIEQERRLKQQQRRQQRQAIKRQRARQLQSSSTLELTAPVKPKQPQPPKSRHPGRKLQPEVRSPAVVPTQDPAEADYTAYIIAGGPSLKGFNWSLLDDKFTVGINRAYEVLPSANIIYFTDEDYYERHIEDMKKHKGRLIKGCINFGQSYDPRVEKFKLTGPQGLTMTPGCLSHGRNSTYAAINMLTQWGFKKIYLLGVDMKWGKRGDKQATHWHDGHKRIDAEGAYQGFIKNFESLVPLLAKHNVTVVNINNSTNLKAFPIETYEEHFGPDCFPSK